MNVASPSFSFATDGSDSPEGVLDVFTVPESDVDKGLAVLVPDPDDVALLAFVPDKVKQKTRASVTNFRTLGYSAPRTGQS